jgi:hypothetical protein
MILDSRRVKLDVGKGLVIGLDHRRARAAASFTLKSRDRAKISASFRLRQAVHIA